MDLLRGSYDVATRALRRLSPLVRGSSKVAQGLRGRERAREVLAVWARAHRDPSRPLVWMHGASVGEALEAKAVLEILRELRPDLQAVYTFFSPSAVGRARALPADVAGYLPWDVRSELAELMAVVRPNLLAFTQKEVWPALTAAARERDVPVALFAARLAPGARRLRPLARRFLRPTFGSLAKVLAIAEADTPRFVEMGVAPDRVGVTGDPGVDSAWERIRAADPRAPYLKPFADHPTPILVAGSTWPSDENVLVPALASLRSDGWLPFTVIIAPHEPTESHLVRIEGDLARAGIRAARLAEVERAGRVEVGSAVVVDRLGVLAQLYTVGSFAYVGGGFHDAGLHSVLEPAAAGLPILFGPRHLSSRGALDLIAAGGARALAGEADLATALREWSSDRTVREATGGKAAGYVERERGAARRTAEALAPYLSRRDD